MKQATTDRRVRSVATVRALALVAAAGLWAGAGGALAADPGKGRQIYMQHCQNCHGLVGTPQMPGIPDFRRGESLFKPDIELVRRIRAGQGMMPAYEGLFTEEELLDVVAFLRTLR
jgi:cytochrome c6